MCSEISITEIQLTSGTLYAVTSYFPCGRERSDEKKAPPTRALWSLACLYQPILKEGGRMYIG